MSDAIPDKRRVRARNSEHRFCVSFESLKTGLRVAAVLVQQPFARENLGGGNDVAPAKLKESAPKPERAPGGGGVLLAVLLDQIGAPKPFPLFEPVACKGC